MNTYYSDDRITLHHGDARDIMRALPDDSVNSCVTSPPYFGLRDYGEPGQYGLEASPAEYVETMRALFAEVWRVLADDGTLWLNIGDSYNAYNGNRGVSRTGFSRNDPMPQLPKGAGLTVRGLPAKSLLGIPWRVAFALQGDGWILRSDVIWAKRNLKPESVTDRPTLAHEYVFMFTKKPRYWYDADAIREESDPKQTEHNERYAREYAAHTARAATTGQPGNVNNVGIHARPGKPGRNARSVWSISAQPFPEAHFATMPPELAER
jgi:DNA modification methylase